MKEVDANIVRCPDPASAEKMLKHIDEIRNTENSMVGEMVPQNLSWMGVESYEGWERGERGVWMGGDHVTSLPCITPSSS